MGQRKILYGGESLCTFKKISSVCKIKRKNLYNFADYLPPGTSQFKSEIEKCQMGLKT